MQMGNGLDWAAVSAGVSILTLVGTVGVGGMMWGKLTERVGGQTKRLDMHQEQLEDNTERLGAHDIQISRLEEWKSGYNAAVTIARHTSEI
jgi:hypothetical protein